MAQRAGLNVNVVAPGRASELCVFDLRDDGRLPSDNVIHHLRFEYGDGALRLAGSDRVIPEAVLLKQGDYDWSVYAALATPAGDRGLGRETFNSRMDIVEAGIGDSLVALTEKVKGLEKKLEDQERESAGPHWPHDVMQKVLDYFGVHVKVKVH